MKTNSDILEELNKSKPRFFVDERNGCVAIRDRNLYDPNDNGCDADKIDVVKFAMAVKDYYKIEFNK